MRHRRRKTRAGFTIIELMVVITVIALILAIAVPGLSTIGRDSRFSSATQTINGALTRSYYAALADVNLAAVRFVPGAWDFDETAEAQRPADRQHLLSYSYAGTNAADPNNLNTVKFGEYFQRREGSSSVQLPHDIWVAPLEAIEEHASVMVDVNGNLQTRYYNDVGEDFVLSGVRNQFDLDAAQSNTSLLRADDFLIAFDARDGVRGGLPTPMHMKAYVPPEYAGGGIEADRLGSTFYRRYSFSGIIIYQRSAFVSLGDDGGQGSVAADRQSWLRRNGRPYLVHRFSGGLVMGSQYSE